MSILDSQNLFIFGLDSYPLTTIPLDEKGSWSHHLPEERRKQLYDGET